MRQWTNDFIGIPFKALGRDRAGADCWGLARIIYQERRGIILPMLDGYEHIRDRRRMSDIIEQEAKSWTPIAKDAKAEKTYDIAVFLMVGEPMHVGIVVRPGTMIHCHEGAGVSVEDYSGPDPQARKWSNRLEGFYRYAEGTSDTTAVSSAS